MTYHPSSAVSLAVVLAAATVLVAGYRAGRADAAWRDLHSARRALHATRRNVLTQTLRFLAAAVLVLTTLFLAAFTMAR